MALPRTVTDGPGTASSPATSSEGLPLTPLGFIASVCSFLGLVAYSSAVGSLFWSPKAAAIPVMAGAGLAGLAELLRRRLASRAHLLALAFLGAASASTLLSSNHTTAVFGVYRLGTGLVFVAALVGAWTIGTTFRPADRRALGVAIAAGLGLNLLAAVAENLVDLDSYQLFLYSDRAPGLMGNPIHIGAMAAAAVGGAVRSALSPRALAVACLGAGMALQLSGSRASLLIALVLIGLAIVASWRRGLIALAAIVIGLAAGSAVASAGDATSSTTRLADTSSSGFSARTENWWSARHAVAEHPILGSGPGTYGAAVSPHRTERLARAEAPDVLFTDAHNLLVEYTVTTGIVGITLFLAWLLFAMRRMTGPYAWFGSALLATHLVQPQFVGSTPLALLCLGVAYTKSDHRTTPIGRAAVLGGTLLGAVLAVLLLAGDWMLRQSELDFTVSRAETANRLLPRWGVTADQLAKLHAFEEIDGGGTRRFDESLRWREEAVRREPADPQWSILLGELRLVRAEPAAARRSFDRALAANPQSIRATLGKANACLLLDDLPCVRSELAHARRIATSSSERRTIRQIEQRVPTG